MNVVPKAIQARDVADLRRSAYGRLPQPVTMKSYLTRPLEKVDGISSEAVVSRVRAIHDTQSDSKENAEKLLALFIGGLIQRTPAKDGTLLPASRVEELREFIRGRIPEPGPSAVDQSQMLSVLFPRGWMAISDPNVWSDSDPLVTSDGAAVLALQWSRVTRHEYENFRDPFPGQIAGTKLSAAGGRIPGLDGFVGQGAVLVADLEGVGGQPPGKSAGITAKFDRGTGTAILDGGLPAGAVRARVHAAANVVEQADGSLDLLPPIPLVNADIAGAILAIDMLSPNQVGDSQLGVDSIDPLNPKGFAVVNEKDIQNGKLYRLSDVRWPVGYQPHPPGKDWWIRASVCSPKVVGMRSYMATSKLAASLNPQSVFMIEQDQEDDICYLTRIVVSGAKDKGSLGPAYVAPVRVPSSISPMTPIIRSIEAKPWNIQLNWMNETDGASPSPIYDSSNTLLVSLECTRIEDPQFQLMDEREDLKRVLARMIAGGWPSGDGEWGVVGRWLSHQLTTAKRNLRDPPRFTDPPKVFDVATAGTLFIAPTGKPGESLSWDAAEDIEIWRRENYLWRVRLRAVENPKFPEFTILSDWSLPTEPIAASPLIPEFLAGQSKAIGKFPRPTIEVYVEYRTRYRKPEEFPKLSYRLVVRKILIASGDTTKTAAFSERVISPSPPQPDGAFYLWRFQFVDREIAAHELFADAPVYDYELELQQLRLGAMSAVVVTKSEIRRVFSLSPNEIITIQGRESSY